MGVGQARPDVLGSKIWVVGQNGLRRQPGQTTGPLPGSFFTCARTNPILAALMSLCAVASAVAEASSSSVRRRVAVKDMARALTANSKKEIQDKWRLD